MCENSWRLPGAHASVSGAHFVHPFKITQKLYELFCVVYYSSLSYLKVFFTNSHDSVQERSEVVYCSYDKVSQMLMPLSQGAHFVHPATEQGLSKSLKSCMNFLVSFISAH